MTNNNLQLTKHRGRDINTGKWHYGNLVVTPHGQACIVNYNDKGGGPMWHQIQPHTVGQYTGRNDRNGAPIYQGDIVSNEGKHLGQVKWMGGKCCYQISPGGVFLSNGLQVIGNIHDNPELLKMKL